MDKLTLIQAAGLIRKDKISRDREQLAESTQTKLKPWELFRFLGYEWSVTFGSHWKSLWGYESSWYDGPIWLFGLGIVGIAWHPEGQYE